MNLLKKTILDFKRNLPNLEDQKTDYILDHYEWSWFKKSFNGKKWETDFYVKELKKHLEKNIKERFTFKECYELFLFYLEE